MKPSDDTSKHNVNNLINHIKYILHNYSKLDKDYFKKHNDFIELFNAFKASTKIISDKVKEDKSIINKLVKIIKKTKKNRIITSAKRKELHAIQKNIMDEYRFLKKSLENLNINFDNIISNIANDSEFKKLDKNKFKKKTHISEYKRRSVLNRRKKIKVKSHNRFLIKQNTECKNCDS